MHVNYTLDEGAFPPIHNYPEDAGSDICCKEDFVVPAHGSAETDTGVHISVPKTYGGLLVSKSGLDVVLSVTSHGLIDAGFTGSIKVRIYNHADEPRHFKAGDKITQIVIVPIMFPVWTKAEKLEGGPRGDNGYGSTGR